MSWVHVDDVVRLLRRAAEDERLSGPVNAVSPEPVRNVDFTNALAHTMNRPALAAAPTFALRVALGELADVVLASQRVLPLRAIQSGFVFRHPDLHSALADLVQSAARTSSEART